MLAGDRGTDGTRTAFGALHARTGVDGAALLVEVLDPAPYDRLLGAREALREVQGRHVLRVLDVHDAGMVHGAVDRRAVLLDTGVPLRPTVRLLGHGLTTLLTARRPTPADDVRAAATLLRQLLPDPAPALDRALAELVSHGARAAAGVLLAPGRGTRRVRRPPAPTGAGWVPPPLGGPAPAPGPRRPPS